MAESIAVEVVSAMPEQQAVVSLQLAPGSTVEQALLASGLIEPQRQGELEGRVGIFGKPVGRQTLLGDGDRVEIYRPLRVDPRESRRRRAARQER